MELIKQGKMNNCGPVALYNAYLNIYNCRPKKTVRKIEIECEVNDNYGTYPWNMYLNSILKLPKTIYNHNKIKKMNKFILLYSFREGEDIYAHYVFVLKNDDNTYSIYNDILKDKNDHIKINEVDFNLNYFENYKLNNLDYPQAWDLSNY